LPRSTAKSRRTPVYPRVGVQYAKRLPLRVLLHFWLTAYGQVLAEMANIGECGSREGEERGQRNGRNALPGVQRRPVSHSLRVWPHFWLTAKAVRMAKKPREPKIRKPNRYAVIIKKVFDHHYKPGETQFEFTRDERLSRDQTGSSIWRAVTRGVQRRREQSNSASEPEFVANESPLSAPRDKVLGSFRRNPQSALVA
jgi:hypothetical protein